MAPDSGAAERFSEIYTEMFGRIHAYAARRAGRDAADEIAAETFLVAWRRFDAMPSEPLPWLYGVARNVVLRAHAVQARQNAARQALESERVTPTQPDAEDSKLWTAWSQLRDADREVLALVAWEELAVSDAARAMGCSAPVFSLRLHRARKRFERLLEQPVTLSRPTSTPSEAS